MRSLAISRRMLVGLVIGAAVALAASVRVAHAPPRALLADTAARAEVVTPVRLAPVVVTQPEVVRAHLDSVVIASHAPLKHQRQHRSPFELLSAFAAIGATSSGGGRKRGGSKKGSGDTSGSPEDSGPGTPRTSGSRRGSKRTAADEAAAAARADPAGTINQSPADVEFNKRSSAGAAGAAQPNSVTAAGRSEGKRFDETVPGGRYKGTDGRIRNAHGELLSDKSE